ncbi:MAG: tRNA (N6-isopentenyl adenosine(37)-C2)-methylthiotransferase MiaB [candidate division Zixibacteria bacterium]|nr:tRNA (N6-isopentenyl adenosine(37)-C2)-methylthiotransferase MiaB [candidate division Zixibacteria bacterium]
MGKKVFMQTFGCQMNVYDSEKLKSILLSLGHSITGDVRKADVIVLNTCSVREKAERRALGRLWDLSRYKSANSHLILVVAGCMAQRMGEELIQKIPYLDLVLGPDQIFQLPEHLKNHIEKPMVVISKSRKDFSCDVFRQEELPQRKYKYTSFVAISRGCDNFCSYCVVPYVRGPEKHRPITQIIKEIQLLSKSGCKEITLIGQNVNSYKYDGYDFSDLLQMASDETEIEWIRFMTSHPKDLSAKLIDKIASLPKVCEHLHLPLQSGSDRILQKMNRAYTSKDYLKLVELAKEKIENLSLTTDLIVGFPSETEEDFQQTLKMVEKIKFDSAFMFRYSVREKTKAASFPDDVPEKVKLERLHTLIELQKQVSQRKNKRVVGRSLEVLVDDVSKRDNKMWKGKTRNNKTVVIQKDKDILGTIASVKIHDADSFTLFGRLS